MIPKLALAALLAVPVAATGAGFFANGPASVETKSGALEDVVCLNDSLVKAIYSSDGYLTLEGKLKYHIAKHHCEYIPEGSSFARADTDADIIVMQDNSIVAVEQGTIGKDPRTWYHLLKIPISTD